MTSPILFAGQEDLSFTPIGSAFGTAAGAGLWLATTTAGLFRSGYARYSLQGRASNGTNLFLRSGTAFSSGNFWTSGRAYAPSPSSPLTSTTALPMRWLDSSGVVRLRLRYNGTGNTPTSLFVVEKITAAGAVTQLGSASTDNLISAAAATPPDKIDVFINYAVSGQITVYRNLTQIFTFSGDVTTDGQTSLAYVDWGTFAQGNFASDSGWSECVVATRDTRNMSLVTQAATALGNTDTFTGGAVANINKNQYTDTSVDFSTTAAQIQEYQVTPAPPTGNFSVVSVVQHGRVTLGASGPTHIDFMVRTGATDFASSDLAPTGAWSLLTNNWDLNPNTSAAWQTSELPASSTSFNFGYKSVV